MARLREELEAELKTAMTEDTGKPDASIVPLFGQPQGVQPPRPGETEAQAVHRMLAELESRLIESQQRTLQRIEGIERNLETMEGRISETGDQAVGRARSLERTMVKLADRIRELEPK